MKNASLCNDHCSKGQLSEAKTLTCIVIFVFVFCAHCKTKSGKCQTLHRCDEATLQYSNVIADSYHLYLTVTTFEGDGNFDHFYQMENFKVVYFGEWLNQAHIRLCLSVKYLQSETEKGPECIQCAKSTNKGVN